MGDEDQNIADGDGPASQRRPDRYNGVAIVLHWLVALLIVLTTGLALFREAFSQQAVWMISAHKVSGICVLVLGLSLFLWRLGHPPPAFPYELNRWEAALAKSVHQLLCALLILVPLAGWIFVSLASETRPLDYRGFDSVPKLWLAENDPASGAWHEAHELLGFALIGLFLVHFIGALRHQFWGSSALRNRMPLRRPRWLLAVVFLSVLLWFVGLLFDISGVRITG